MLDIEYKTVGVTGVLDTSFKDGPGVVTAIVSVTGIRDNVGDVIEPGAYAESLTEITPKGAWHHDWTTPVSRSENVKELMPGDPLLPKSMPNGAPWPKQAGALMVKMKFNLDTQRGKEAHSDVLFFGDQQEWSIGYKVPEGGARHVKSAEGPTRYISRLKCYEYSPVLFGAMPSARTTNVKDAQLSFKSLMGIDLSEFLTELDGHKTAAGFETKSAHGSHGHVHTASCDDDDDDDYGMDDDFDDEEKGMLMELGIKPGDLRQAITVMTKVLDFLDGRKDGDVDVIETIEAGPAFDGLDDAVDAAHIELEALNYDSTSDAVAAVLGLTDDQRDSLERLADQYDNATDDEDREALLDAIGEELEQAEGIDTFNGLRVTARVAGDMAEVAEGEKSSRLFGPEYKELAGIRGRRARHEAYLVQLKSTRPDVLDGLAQRYEGTGMHRLFTEVKSVASPDQFVIDTKALNELTALAKID